MLLTQKAVQPSDCVLGIGIPVNRDQFERDLVTPGKDFVPVRCRSWLRYHALIVEPYEWARPRILATGARIVEDLTLAELAAQCELGRRVITLLSHWTGTAVEFADGLHSVPDVAGKIPADYEGILDLSICQSDKLGVTLRDRCPKALVKVSDRKAVADFWLAVYRVTYVCLSAEPLDFPTALARSINSIVH